jgi:NUMOD4 motif-containing protein/HNH endonuclease
MKQIEEWRPVGGFEGLYEVSSAGRVRSLPRTALRPGLFYDEPPRVVTVARGTILCPRTKHNGYHQVAFTVGGKKTAAYVQRLVLNAFVGPAPSPQHQSAHLNGKPYDNRVENLQWVTPKENSSQKILHGTNTHDRTKKFLKQQAAVVLAANGFTLEQVAWCLNIAVKVRSFP